MDHRVRRFLILASALVFGAGCRRQAPTVEPLSAVDPPKRASASFIHCVEAQAAGCVQRTRVSGGADALFILSWLSEGSALGILSGAATVAARHADASVVQAVFVDAVERYAASIRGAECDPVSAHPAQEVAATLADRSRARVAELGLQSADMTTFIAGLRDEVGRDLGGGHVVVVECRSAPYQLFLVTRQEGRAHEVVGLATSFAGLGEELSADQVEARLQGRALGLADARSTVLEGTVHPYLPIAPESL